MDLKELRDDQTETTNHKEDQMEKDKLTQVQPEIPESAGKAEGQCPAQAAHLDGREQDGELDAGRSYLARMEKGSLQNVADELARELAFLDVLAWACALRPDVPVNTSGLARRMGYAHRLLDKVHDAIRADDLDLLFEGKELEHEHWPWQYMHAFERWAGRLEVLGHDRNVSIADWLDCLDFEMILHTCPDCGAGIGHLHATACARNCCIVCNLQEDMCECSCHERNVAVWTGRPDVGDKYRVSKLLRIADDLSSPEKKAEMERVVAGMDAREARRERIYVWDALSDHAGVPEDYDFANWPGGYEGYEEYGRSLDTIADALDARLEALDK